MRRCHNYRCSYQRTPISNKPKQSLQALGIANRVLVDFEIWRSPLPCKVSLHLDLEVRVAKLFRSQQTFLPQFNQCIECFEVPLLNNEPSWTFATDIHENEEDERWSSVELRVSNWFR